MGNKPTAASIPPVESYRDLLVVLEQLSKPCLLLSSDEHADHPLIVRANAAAQARFPWAGPSAEWSKGLPGPVEALVSRTLDCQKALVEGAVRLDGGPSVFRLETALTSGGMVYLTIDDVTVEHTRRNLIGLLFDLADDMDDIVLVCPLDDPGCDTLDLPVIVSSNAVQSLLVGRPGTPTLGAVVGTIFGPPGLARLAELRAEPGHATWRAGRGQRQWQCSARTVPGFLGLVLKDVSTQASILQTITTQARLLVQSQEDSAMVRRVMGDLVERLVPRQARVARGLGDALERSDLARARAGSDALAESTAEMYRLLSSIRTFTTIKAGASTSNAVHLDELVDLCIEQERAEITRLGASVERGRLPVLWGNETLLGMMIQHLVQNALQAARPGVPLRVMLTAERDGHSWRIHCDDNGLGIPPAERDRIFEPLHQIPHRHNGGSGLGLAICKRIAELHGGDIGVSDKHGPGSRVWVELRGL